MKNSFKKRLLTLLTAAAMMLVLAVPALAALDTSTLPDNVFATAYKDGQYPTLSMADDAIDHSVAGSVAVNPGNPSLVDISIPVQSISMGWLTGCIVGLEIPAFGTLGTDYTVTAPAAPYSSGNLVITVDPAVLYASGDDVGASRLYDASFAVQLYLNGQSLGLHPVAAVADLEIDVRVTP